MGWRFIPRDMLRHNDFLPILRSLPGDRLDKISETVQRLIEEHPDQRVNLSAGPAYFLMHYLMSDLYTALALYQTEPAAGQRKLLAKMDAVLQRAGKKANRKMRFMMVIPGTFSVARTLVPKVMVMGNGRGFMVRPVDCGKDGFGFDVTECPYFRLFAANGCPELGPIFCRFDEAESADLPGLVFLRQGTLCTGYDKCDFRYVKKDRTNNPGG
ncbi:MAG: L-2-amino-thiazoline-4-carboxylic acid hydrolase [Lachnospiraceae bacterium]|nr:L-2-amino-thiazoline-4-carboxylic acid hydrolase [Lachnospiraceae bacterium]